MAMNGGGSAAYVEGWPVARASRTDVSTAAVISWREAYGLHRFRIALSRGMGLCGGVPGTGVYAPVVVPRQILRLVDRLAHAWGQQLYVSDDVEAGAVLLQQVPGATATGSVVSRASRGGIAHPC